MTQYTTSAPGDVRRRTRHISITIPGDERTFDDIAADPYGGPKPTVTILEQDFVRLADREVKLRDLGEVPVGVLDFSETFQRRNMATDEIVPDETATVADVVSVIYEFTRHKQTLRDDADATKAAADSAITSQLAADTDNGAANQE